MKQFTCLRCNYVWVKKSNKKRHDPKSCPSCKRYDWKTKPVAINQ